MTNPWASLLFFWPELERQVRIEGRVEKLSAAESDRYYQSRHWQSAGAWASPQSSVIPNAQWLMDRQANFTQTLGEDPAVPNTGVATGCCRTSMSSGRAVHLACTIEFVTGARVFGLGLDRGASGALVSHHRRKRLLRLDDFGCDHKQAVALPGLRLK